MSLRRGLRALALTLFIAFFGLSCSTNIEKRDERLAKADAYLEEGKTNEALLELRGALRLDPQSSEVNYRIAEVFLGKGDASSALFFFREARRLDPTRIDAPIEEAGILFLEDPDAADALVEEVLETDPAFAPAYWVRSKAALVREDLDSALQAALTAAELAPQDPISHVQVGKVYQGQIRMGQIKGEPAEDPVFEAALAAYQRAHELSVEESWHALQLRADVYGAWPGHGAEAVEAHRKAVAVATEEGSRRGMDTTLGSTLTYALSAGDLGFQAEALEAYVAHDPRAVDRWFQLAKVEEARGGSADDVLKRMLYFIPKDPRAHLRYATHLIETDRSEEAFTHLESSAEAGVETTALLSTLVARLLEARKPSEAVRIVTLLERDYPEDPNTALARASLDFDQGRIEEAATQLRVLVGRSQSPAAWQLLAQVEQRRGYLSEAIEAATEAVELAEEIGSPLPERALRLRAHLQVAAGDWLGSLRGFSALVRNGAQMAPRDQVLRARALYGLGRRRAAAATLAPLINREDPYPPAAMEYAEQEFVALPEVALQVIEKALTADPTNPGLLLWAARLHLARGETQQAVERVQVALRAKRATPALLLERARALAVTGNMELAQRDALRALERDPNLDGAIPLLMALFESEGGEAVIESFEEADAVGALQPPARYLLARLHRRAGNQERARALLEELAESDLASAKNDLAYLLAEEGVELTRAQGLAEEASRELRGQPETAHTLGYVFLRKNLYGAALEQFRFAASNPQGATPLVHYHTGLALQGLERLEEAEKAFAQALALDGGMAEAARALEEVRAVTHQASSQAGPS